MKDIEIIKIETLVDESAYNRLTEYSLRHFIGLKDKEAEDRDSYGLFTTKDNKEFFYAKFKHSDIWYTYAYISNNVNPILEYFSNKIAKLQDKFSESKITEDEYNNSVGRWRYLGGILLAGIRKRELDYAIKN